MDWWVYKHLPRFDIIEPVDLFFAGQSLRLDPLTFEEYSEYCAVTPESGSGRIDTRIPNFETTAHTVTHARLPHLAKRGLVGFRQHRKHVGKDYWLIMDVEQIPGRYAWNCSRLDGETLHIPGSNGLTATPTAPGYYWVETVKDPGRQGSA